MFYPDLLKISMPIRNMLKLNLRVILPTSSCMGTFSTFLIYDNRTVYYPNHSDTAFPNLNLNEF
jgi:hypothetical protein